MVVITTYNTNFNVDAKYGGGIYIYANPFQLISPGLRCYYGVRDASQRLLLNNKGDPWLPMMPPVTCLLAEAVTRGPVRS